MGPFAKAAHERGNLAVFLVDTTLRRAFKTEVQIPRTVIREVARENQQADARRLAGILRKNDWNAAYYGPGVLPQQIVIDRKVTNPNTKDLVNALSPY